MIPARRREKLPAGTDWVITDDGGQLLVVLSEDIPADSVAEQLAVIDAVRAWHHDRDRGRRGLVVIPGIGVGAAWAARQVRHPAAAGGTAVAAVAAIATGYALSPDPHGGGATHARPPAAAGPVTPGKVAPGRSSKPPAAGKPSHAHPRRAVRGGGSAPVVASPVALRLPNVVAVPNVSIPRHLPARVLPVRTPKPPVTVPTSPPVLTPAVPVRRCLVRIRVGRVVRICL